MAQRQGQQTGWELQRQRSAAPPRRQNGRSPRRLRNDTVMLATHGERMRSSQDGPVQSVGRAAQVGRDVAPRAVVEPTKGWARGSSQTKVRFRDGYSLVTLDSSEETSPCPAAEALSGPTDEPQASPTEKPQAEVSTAMTAKQKLKRATTNIKAISNFRWPTALFSSTARSTLTRVSSALEDDKNRQLITELKGHTARTKSCCVFDHDTKAVSTSDDNTLRVWNLETGECIGILGCDRSELLEHRVPADFPENLGPFGAQETTLRPMINFTNLQYCITKQEISSLLKRGPSSKRFWSKLLAAPDDALSAAISKPCRITLPDDAKPSAGIPEQATHFVWAHQLKAAEQLSDDEIDEFVNMSGEAAFVINGGYVYFEVEKHMDPDDHTTWKPARDEEMLVQANALCICGVVKFQFGAAVPVSRQQGYQQRALERMISEQRFQKVTITPLRQKGARYYCWVLPQENLAAPTDEPWTPCEHGGFMYLLTDPNAEEDKLPDNCEGCRFFELTLGHESWVRGCCVLPGEQSVLSCSADKSLWLWDLKTGKGLMKLTGHTNWVWECCVYEPQIGQIWGVSCSSDRTLRVWDLNTGEERLRLDGHEDWVMSCSVYSVEGHWRAISSSRDKTMRSWDLNDGKCMYTFQGHEDMVGGCKVYKEDGTNWAERSNSVAGEADRALTCSDDRTLRVWDLIDNKCLLTIPAHQDIIINCCIFWNNDAHRQFGVSCSADGTMRVWDLQDGRCERFIEDTDKNSRVRGCVALSDGSKILACSGNFVRVWDRELLVKTEPAVSDVSLTMEHRTELLWKWWPHMELHEHKGWAQRLLYIMNPRHKEQLTPFDCQTLLYGKDCEGVTLIHKLANEDDGAAVMNYILAQHQPGRRRAVLGTEGNELTDRQSEMTLGLISRAGNSHGRSVLSVAINGLSGEKKNLAKAAPMVRVLLDDYCEMTNAVRWDQYKKQQFARYDRFEPLSEHDVVDLFQKFPRDAVSFLQRLKLRPTHDLRPEGTDFIRCDTDDPALVARMLVRSSHCLLPARSDKMGWWHQMIEERFYKKRNWQCFNHEKITCATKTSLVPISDRYTTGRDSHRLPFSRVLDESRRYAENYASAELFAAPVLQAILCHKWESGCKNIFLIHFATYVIYLIVLTYLIMFDHFTQLSNCDRDTTACVSANWSWIICCVLSTLHVKYELHQLHRLGWKYFTSFWNQIGLASVLLTVVALALMQGQTEGSWTSLSSGTLRVIHTSALFSRWLKLLFFMRGLDSTAPLIKLLSNIMREMQSFLVLLLVLLTCFTFVFCLLLRDTDSDRDEFGTTSDAWLRTYGMMLGNFHTQWFDEADTHGLATCFFVVFTVSVPVIMLNALIAIMSDTYARSKTLEVANGRLMRADLILELESLIGEVKHTQDVEKKCHGSCMCSIWLVIQILLTFKISSNEQATGAYLHVLSFEDTPSGSEQEYELTSYPFKYNASDGGLLGAPTVAIGDVSQHERLPANKADVEKLMAQNVQLMSEMMEQREAQINLQEEIVRLRKE